MNRLWALLCRCVLLLAVGLLTFNAVTVGMQYPLVGIAAAVTAALRNLRRKWRVTGNFGTARLADWSDLFRGKLRSKRGLILGRVGYVAPPTAGQAIRSLLSPAEDSELACRQFFAAFCRKRRADDFIRIDNFVHLLTASPAGGGKSVSSLVPNLQSYDGNCVVIDPKGELYRLTAKHRRKRFRHKIIRLDPAGLCGPAANGFNPLDFIDPRASDFLDQCRDLANMLVVRTGKEPDGYWNDSAETVIAAFIAHVCASETNPVCRNLRGVRTLVASRQNYQFALEMMQQNADFHGVLQQLGAQLAWHVDRELGSTMSNVQRHTNLFDSPLIVDSTSSTDWNPAELRRRRMTVYLIVPPDKLVVWAAWTRVVMGSLLRIITRGTPTEKNPVLFMVDECAHIGQMQALQDAVTLMRGMGIRMWLFFQSIEQLNQCFGDHAATVLDNLGTQQFFSLNSYATAEAISKRIGHETIVNVTEGGNKGISRSFGGDGREAGNRSTGTSTTVSEAARLLLMPEEILRLPDSAGIVFHRNNPPILCQLIKYYSDKAFRYRWSRGFGTGRTHGLGLGGMLLALALLAMSGIVTAFVGTLPVPAGRWPNAADSSRLFDSGPAGVSGDGFRDSGPMWRVEPWQQPPVIQPAPYVPTTTALSLSPGAAGESGEFDA
jgi:type IV secretion system protein VirD4